MKSKTRFKRLYSRLNFLGGLPKAEITRSSFLRNFLTSMFFELSHLDAIFLLSYLPDGSVWVFQQTNRRSYHLYFFAVKTFMQYYGVSLKFAVAIEILYNLSIHYYISFAKMMGARSQKQKAPATVINNSDLSSAANCVIFFCTSNEMK